MNPRYEVYARVHGRTYNEMLAYDETLYPSGKMAGFIIWISERWRAWRILRGIPEHQFLMLRDHVDFDAWLQEKYPIKNNS